MVVVLTVEELINILKEYPMDMRVLVDGYEGGFDDPCLPQKVTVCGGGHPYWWEGDYDELHGPKEEWPRDHFHAVLISRGGK